MTKARKSRYKGKVGVATDRGVLRIRLPRFLFGGKQIFISTGLKNTPKNRKIVEAKANKIEADIVLERFDYTLERYKNQSVSISRPTKHLTLVALFERFMEVKKPTVRPGTYKNGYKVMLSHLNRSPFSKTVPDTDQTGFAQRLADWATANLTPDTTKRFLIKLNACMEWAIASKLVELKESPFNGIASKIVNRKGIRVERDINPFTFQERSAIIEHYRSHLKYSHYSLFVEFCFSVGCRPSEAVALQRENISANLGQITFTHAVVNGEKGRQRIKGLKTQEKRTIYTSQSVQKILTEALNRSTNQIVFPGVKGGWFGYKTFRKTWKIVLKELQIEYRKPYQMRHTFITLCLEAGLNVKDVAKIVGNSPEIIYRHYVENRLKVVIPDL